MHHITFVVALCARALAHCVPGHSLLAVSSRALALGMCACALARSWHRVLLWARSWHLVHACSRSLSLVRGIVCVRGSDNTALLLHWLHFMSHANDPCGTMKSSCVCYDYHMIISCVRTKRKQNSDVFLDLFWLIFRIPKTLVLFLHTTKVPEAAREWSAPNKQTIVLWGTKKYSTV